MGLKLLLCSPISKYRNGPFFKVPWLVPRSRDLPTRSHVPAAGVTSLRLPWEGSRRRGTRGSHSPGSLALRQLCGCCTHGHPAFLSCAAQDPRQGLPTHLTPSCCGQPRVRQSSVRAVALAANGLWEGSPPRQAQAPHSCRASVCSSSTVQSRGSVHTRAVPPSPDERLHHHRRTRGRGRGGCESDIQATIL